MIEAAIIGISGYTGGELARLLLIHPEAEITYASSRTHNGKLIGSVHPHLRKLLNLRIQSFNPEKISDSCNFVFFATPHGVSQTMIPQLMDRGLKIIDLSADFRLKNLNTYVHYYGRHTCPELVKKAVYGLPEIHKEEIKKAEIVACPGCMASASILPLAPLISEKVIDLEKIVVDAKIGSSGSGVKPSRSTHHPERANVIRPYKVAKHRHTAEIEQELSLLAEADVKVSFSAHAVDTVRGILATIHSFPLREVTEKELWRIYRKFYGQEPFIRIIKRREGLYSLPDPKTLIGSNFCDIGFEIDEHVGRVVLVSALDNLVKGAAGQAIQNMNLVAGLDETTGLFFPGLFPV